MQNSDTNNELKKEAGPLTRLFYLLLEEKEHLTVFLIYTVIISLLYLTVPLAAQIVVNTIASSILLQPLLLISLSVLIGLLFLGVLRLFQLYITEILQRKIFTNISFDIANKIPRAEHKHFGKIYAPELVNRFFDTITIQKSLSSILLEVPAAILQIVMGAILMGIYNPLLLLFDTALVLGVIFLMALGYKGLSTSIEESTAKYKVANWLEELARCQVSFKMNGVPEYLTDEVDSRVLTYLQNRKKHFQVILRQFTVNPPKLKTTLSPLF